MRTQYLQHLIKGGLSSINTENYWYTFDPKKMQVLLSEKSVMNRAHGILSRNSAYTPSYSKCSRLNSRFLLSCFGDHHFRKIGQPSEKTCGKIHCSAVIVEFLSMAQLLVQNKTWSRVMERCSLLFISDAGLHKSFLINFQIQTTVENKLYSIACDIVYPICEDSLKEAKID